MPTSTTSSLKTKAMFAALGALLAVAALFSLCAGASGLSLWEGLTRPDSAAARILVHIRLPRTLAAVLSGAALAASGAIIQGVLGNPMAGPSVIGVNAGAGFLTLLFCWLFPSGAQFLPAAAFVGAMGTTLLILLLVQRTGASKLTVVLAGVAVSAILSAGSDLITTLAPEVTLGLKAFRVGGFAGKILEKLGDPKALQSAADTMRWARGDAPAAGDARHISNALSIGELTTPRVAQQLGALGTASTTASTATVPGFGTTRDDLGIQRAYLNMIDSRYNLTTEDVEAGIAQQNATDGTNITLDQVLNFLDTKLQSASFNRQGKDDSKLSAPTFDSNTGEAFTPLDIAEIRRRYGL